MGGIPVLQPGPAHPITVAPSGNRIVVTVGGGKSINAIWTYEAPYPALAGIKDHVAFYPDRVDAITVESL